MTQTGFPDFEPPRIEVPQPPSQPPAQPQQPAHPPPPSRRRGGLLAVCIALAIALALLVAADRIAPRIVAGRIADTLQFALGLDQRPTVEVGGFPFLTQVATRRYQRVSVHVGNLSVGGRNGALLATDVDATLTDVRPDRSYRSYRIGRVTVSGTIPYSTLTGSFGVLSISYDGRGPRGDGYVKIMLADTVRGRAKPAIDPATGEFVMEDPHIWLGGQQLPPDASRGVFNTLLHGRLPDLLPGVAPEKLLATRAGLRLTAVGRNVRIGR